MYRLQFEFDAQLIFNDVYIVDDLVILCDAVNSE